MHGYLVCIHFQAVGDAPAWTERVYVVCDREEQVYPLVRAARHLDNQVLEIVRELPEPEWKALRLKPYQVKKAKGA
jgi:hypothetical protein